MAAHGGGVGLSVTDRNTRRNFHDRTSYFHSMNLGRNVLVRKSTFRSYSGSVSLCIMHISKLAVSLSVLIIFLLVLGCSDVGDSSAIASTLVDTDQAEPEPTLSSDNRPVSVTPEMFSTPGDAVSSTDTSSSGSLLSSQATVLAEDSLTESLDVNADIPATVAAAFTATAEAKPRSEIDNVPDVPATVAAAFTATAEIEIAIVNPNSVTPKPYVPTYTEYLEALGWRYTPGPVAFREGNARQSLIDNFGTVVSVYLIESELGETRPTRDGFDSVVSFVYESSTGYDPYLLDSIKVLYSKWLTIAADSKPGGSVGGFLIDPNRDQAMLLCFLADQEWYGLDSYQRPPEPACETAFAEYNLFDTDNELGYLGYLKKRFSVPTED